MSSILKFIFTVLLFSLLSAGTFAQVTFSSSNLPLVVINTSGQQIMDDSKIYATLGIIWNGPGKRNTLNDPKNNFNGKIAIELRGSSSQMFPKKSYGFETKSIDLLDIDVSLLGMPEENDWILYAPYTDKTMIRDVLSFTLDTSLDHYSPRCRFVELFLNNQYQGIYVLMEKIKRNKNRVDIAKLTITDNSGENLTGGYIIKIDKLTGGGGDGWFSDYSNIVNNTYYQYDYPKSKEITSAQKTYIQAYFRNMEKTLYQEKFSGTGSYHEFLNDSSFIDFMIMNEMAKNVDGYRLSSYFYKGKNERINCGPIWDFNLTYGNANYYNGWLTTGFQYQVNMGMDQSQNPFWWNKLLRDQAYVKKLKKRWATLRKKELSNQRITFVIDSLTNVIAEAQVRNFQKWPILGTYIWPNYNYAGNSYGMEVGWMKNWINQRLTFLDQQWQYDFTGTESELISQTSSVFPNPFANQLTIQFAPILNGDGYAEFYSASGSLLQKNKVAIQSGQIQLVFSENDKLSPGLYMLRITSNDRILLNEKVLKNR